MKHPPCGAFGAPLSPDPSPARGEGSCYPLSPRGRGAGGEGGRPQRGGVALARGPLVRAGAVSRIAGDATYQDELK